MEGVHSVEDLTEKPRSSEVWAQWEGSLKLLLTAKYFELSLNVGLSFMRVMQLCIFPCNS